MVENEISCVANLVIPWLSSQYQKYRYILWIKFRTAITILKWLFVYLHFLYWLERDKPLVLFKTGSFFSVIRIYRKARITATPEPTMNHWESTCNNLTRLHQNRTDRLGIYWFHAHSNTSGRERSPFLSFASEFPLEPCVHTFRYTVVKNTGPQTDRLFIYRKWNSKVISGKRNNWWL